MRVEKVEKLDLKTGLRPSLMGGMPPKLEKALNCAMRQVKAVCQMAVHPQWS